jgi:UDP-2,4-diacetamido-2,4,6-trideoxy-beta-L-altropyranose hydrolase
VKRPLFFRVDGSTAIGLGHLIRCQALAQSLNPSFQSTFFVRELESSIQRQLTDARVTLWHIPASISIGLEEAEWVASQLIATDTLVLDGYHFTPAYQRLLAATGIALLCIDDLITPPIWANAVLNQAGGVSATAYAHVPLAELCLGPSYALLRPEFWANTASLAASAQPRLFLNMGGADPTNQTAVLLPLLRQRFPAYRLAVVTGAAYPFLSDLQKIVVADGAITLFHNLPAAEFAALLRTCQVFVCPPSGVAYECCASGGAVLLHPTADNQQALFTFLVQQELAIPLTDGFALVESDLSALAAQQLMRQRQLFDGLAAQRLQTTVFHLVEGQHYTIRQAEAQDAALYFTWANDPGVRLNAIQSETISWPTHIAWFARRIQDVDSYLYILQAPSNEPIGQVRIEFDSSTLLGTIDYSLAPAYRGMGLGKLLLRRALQRLRHDRPGLAGQAVQGYVKASNQASARVFEQLRFVRQETVTLQGEVCEVFRLDFPFLS